MAAVDRLPRWTAATAAGRVWASDGGGIVGIESVTGAGMATRQEVVEQLGPWPSVETPDVHFPRELNSDKRLSDAVAWVTWRDEQRAAVKKQLDERIAALTANAAAFLDAAGCNHPRYDDAIVQIGAYARKHRRRLMVDGKTIHLSGGVISVRKAPESLTPTHRQTDATVVSLIDAETGATAAVNEALERVGARPWLTAKLSLDKTGIKAAVKAGEVDSVELSKRFLRLEQPENVTTSRAA